MVQQQGGREVDEALSMWHQHSPPFACLSPHLPQAMPMTCTATTFSTGGAMCTPPAMMHTVRAFSGETKHSPYLRMN